MPVLQVKKPFLLGGIAAVLIATGAVWYVQSHKGPNIAYQTVSAERGEVVSKVTATGTLSALVTVQVGSQVSGRILQLMVDYNSPVRKGQVLAKLDPQLFQAALEQAQARYQAAKSDLTRVQVQASYAERKLARTKLLAERRLIAMADLDAAQAELDGAQAQVMAQRANLEQAKAALSQAEVNLNYTTIVSPINGVVISRSVDVGQTVAASLQAPTLFVIAQDLRKIQVISSVAEADISKLAPRMTAEFTVDAFPEEKFTGVVSQIRSAPQTVQNVVTYDTLVNVDNPQLKLKPGMTANVTFICDRRENVLRVPSSALRFRPMFGKGDRPHRQEARNPEREKLRRDPDQKRQEGPRVWVLRDGKPRPVKLQTGLSDGSYLEVVKGKLEEGDPIIVGLEGDQKQRDSRPSGQRRMRGIF